MIQQPLSFMLPNTDDWSLPNMADLPSWAGAKRVSIDLETRDPQLTTLGPGVRRDGYVIGISFAIEDGPSFYLPTRHQGGENLDEKNVWRYIKHQAENFRGEVVGANLGYDVDYLWEYGAHFKPSRYRDVQVAEPLLDEYQYQYGLNAIALRYGLIGKDEDTLEQAAKAYGVNPKKEMWKLPARFVGKYAIRDAHLPLKLLRLQERRIDSENLWQVYDLESDLLPVLVKMRRRGVPVNLSKLEFIENWAVEQEREALRMILQESGVQLSMNGITDDAVISILKACNISVDSRTKGGKISVNADTLQFIDHPVIKWVMRGRRFNKLRTTFCNSIRQHQINGRLHPSFNQLRTTSGDDDRGSVKGTVTGRLSSTDPNIQQQPSRDREIGPVWRGIYEPEPGEQWACLDYSQQEPRWMVHFAELRSESWLRSHKNRIAAKSAMEAASRYRNNPNADNHTMMAQIVAGKGEDWEPSKKERDDAKTIFLGLAYAMKGAGLCEKLGHPTDWLKLRNGRYIKVAGPEGEKIISKFKRAVPFVEALAQEVEDKAQERGYITTILGRRCRFPLKEDGKNREDTRKGLNKLIQGTSADQMKKAMVDCENQGFEPFIQVHDELDASVPNREYAEAMADVMRNSVPCRVPSKVDVELGPNWGNVK